MKPVVGKYPCADAKCFYCERRTADKAKYRSHPIFHVGQAVWVKTTDRRNLFPAQVVDPTTLRMNDGSIGTKITVNHMVTVLYFEGVDVRAPTHENVTLSKREKVVPGFRSLWDDYSSKSHGAAFQKALDEVQPFYFEDPKTIELDPDSQEQGEISQSATRTTRKRDPPKQRGRKVAKKDVRQEDRASPSVAEARPKRGRKRKTTPDDAKAAQEETAAPAPLSAEPEASVVNSSMPELDAQEARDDTPPSKVRKRRGRPAATASSRANPKTSTAKCGRVADIQVEAVEVAAAEAEEMVQAEDGQDVDISSIPELFRPLTRESLVHLARHKAMREHNAKQDQRIAELRAEIQKEREETEALKQTYKEKLPQLEERNKLQKLRLCGPRDSIVSKEQFGLIADGRASVHIARHLRAETDRYRIGPRQGLIIYHAKQGDDQEVQREREDLAEFGTLVETPKQLMEQCDIVMYLGDVVDKEQLYTNIISDADTGLFAGLNSGASKGNYKPGLVILRNLGMECLDKIQNLKPIRSRECLFLFAPALGPDGWAHEGILHYAAAGDKSLHERCKMIYDYTGRGFERTVYLNADVHACCMFAHAVDRVKYGALLGTAQMMEMIKKANPDVLKDQEKRAAVMECIRKVGAELAGDVYRKAIPAMDIEGESNPGDKLHSFKHVTKDLQMEISHASALGVDTGTSAALQQLMQGGKQHCGENADCAKVVIPNGLFWKG